MEPLIKILMLEDSSADAGIIQRLILKGKLNCEFRVTKDKTSYEVALEHFGPTVILSDHTLPQFNSQEAFSIARKRFPDIPFIMVTGTVSEEFAAEMIKMGVDDYILKDRMARLPAAIVLAIQRKTAEKEKQETAQKIIQSENNLRAIFENTSEGFLLIDRNAVILAFNNKAGNYSLLSKENEARIGQSIYDCVESSRKEFFEGIIQRALNGESIQYDRSYVLDDGSTSWIDFSVTPVIETGQVKGICITGRNITEKKIIEQEREFDRDNLKALINNTNDLMWSVDTDLKLITSNDAFGKLAKLISGKTVTKGSDILASGYSKEQLHRFHKYYERAFSGESFTEIEHAAFPDDFWSEISFYPIYNRNTIIGAACFSHDITRIKKAEKEITDYKNALDQSSIVSITDQQGRIKHVNDNFCIISGYQAAELIGLDHRIINSGYHPKSFIEDLWKTIVNGKIWRGEFCNKSKQGTLYWVDATIIPFLNDIGQPVQYIEITNDITGKKIMEQEILEQKVQEQKKLAKAIINAQEKERNSIGQELHDNINQILAGTNLFLSVAKRNPAKSLEHIESSIKNIQYAIEQNRKMAHELVAPDFDAIRLANLINSLSDDMLKNAGIEVRIDTSALNEYLLKDEQKLAIYRIAQEQCTNIIKYAEAKSVSISLSVQDGFFNMVIADDGKGMGTGKKASGIGLRNIQGRINILNGTANITTDAGKGFTLEIAIPLNTDFRQ
jgi:two-component system sensor histidine kinase NreB